MAKNPSLHLSRRALIAGSAAGLAATATLPEEDHRHWRSLRDLDAPDHPINRPDFHFYDAPAVAVGRVPA